MSDSIKIKIKNKFTNPLTNRRAKIDEEFNVPKNQFWLKRIKEKDCVQIKKFTKAIPVKKNTEKNPKGSK